MAQKFLTDIELTRGLKDSSGDLGTSGQVLSSTGSALNWVDNTASASVVYQDGFTGDGSTTAFTLGNSIDNENKTQVYIDGVYQHKDTYSLSGTTLTFSTAPPNTSDIEVISFKTVTADGDILTDSEFSSAGLMKTNGSGVYSIVTDNSSNWNTAYTYSQVGHLPLAGGTLTGGLTGTTATFSASVIASGNSNSFGNTTVGALTASSISSSGSLSISGNSNSIGATTFTNGVTLSGGTIGQAKAVLHTNNIIYFRGGSNGLFLQNADGSDGYYISNADHKWEVGSSESMRLTSTGLGIGTTTPDGKLEVAGGTTLGLRITNAGDSSAYDQTRITYSGYNSGSPEMVFMPLTTPGSGIVNTFFRFRNTNGSSTASNNVANVSIDGNVGIGTDSPTARLDILTNSTSGTNSIDRNVRFRADNGEERFDFFVGRSGNSAYLNIHNSSETLTTKIHSSGASYFNGGNVGIGTTSVSAKLHVSGTGNQGVQAWFGNGFINNSLYHYDFARVGFSVEDQDGADTGAGFHFNTRNSADTNWMHGYIYQPQDGGIVFGTGGAGTTTATEKMRITSGGNIGIGKTSPSQKLDVEGSIRLNSELQIFTGTTDIGQISNSGGALNIQGTSTRDVSLGSDSYPQVIFIEGSNGRVAIGGSTTSANSLTLQGTGTELDLSNTSTNGKNYRIASTSSGVLEFIDKAANVERMRIHSDGKIGIGVTPTNNLHIGGVSNYNGIEITGAGASRPSLKFSNINQGQLAQIYATEGYALTIATGTSSVERMRIRSSGTVGIGAAGFDSQMLTIAAGTLDGAIYATSTDANCFASFRDNSSTANIEFGAIGNNHVFRKDATEHMRIDSNGVLQLTTTANHGFINANTVALELDVNRNPETGAFSDTGKSHARIQIAGDNGGSNIKFNTASGNNVTASEKMRITKEGNVGINITNPETALRVKGIVGTGAAIHDPNAAYSVTGFGVQDGGALHMTFGLSAVTSSGDTITFTYAATSWKSWSLNYNFASTNGVCKGVVGGYWNNSGGSTNHTETDNLGVSVAVTHTGQGNTVTFTFTALGTHPMAHFVYMQSGGDGQPRADRVTLNATT